MRLLRPALIRYVRAAPRPADMIGAERRVCIMLTTAWGMGGTIRAALNLAGYLAERGYEVQIISAMRTRDKPFFEFPAGVEVTALDDRRRKAPAPRGLHKLLRSLGSALMHPCDLAASSFSLWSDVMLVRLLRRRTGFLVTTRPGFNLIAAQLKPPGLITIGQEQMNLRVHGARLRRAMVRGYRGLDALAVLTESDMRSYAQRLNGRARLERIPNTVRDLGPAKADLEAEVVITAGRLTRQKGYDLLIPAWRSVADRHPDWRLRIFGSGESRESLQALIEEHRLTDVVTLEGPARSLGDEMTAASVYVLSSRFEGLPLVLLEAMSKGMAAVSFDCPTGPSDVIDDHRNGILVPPRDVDALAAGILELIEDPELRRRCGAAAVETARDYTMDAVGPRWEALMRDLHAERTAAQ